MADEPEQPAPEQPEPKGPTLDITSQPMPEEPEQPSVRHHGEHRKHHRHRHRRSTMKDVTRLVGGGLMVGCVVLLGLAAWTEDAVVFHLGVRGTMVLASILVVLDGTRAVYESWRRDRRRSALLKGAAYLVVLIGVITVLRHLLLG